MLIFLYIFVIIINLLAIVSNKRNKLVEFITIFFILLLFCGNSKNGDYHTYFDNYNAGNLANEFEIGFAFLGNLFYSAGLHYNFFVSFLAIIMVFIIYRTCLKLTDSFHVFSILWFGILLFYDIDQLRNFIVSGLFFLGVVFLLQKKKIHYIITIIIAFLFHKLAIIYLPLVLVNPKTINKHWKYIIGFSLIMCVVVFINRKQIPGLDVVISLITRSDAKSVYADGSQMNFGFLVSYFLFFLNIALFAISELIVKQNGSRLTNTQKEFFNWTRALIILGFLFLPFIMTNLTYDRITRNINYLVFVDVAIAMKSFCYKRTTNGFFYKTFFVIFIAIHDIVWNFGTVFRYGTEPTEMYYILNNNFILDNGGIILWPAFCFIGVMAIFIVKSVSWKSFKKKRFCFPEKTNYQRTSCSNAQ